MRCTIASQLVRHQPAGHATLPLQQLPEEAFGSPAVATRLHEDVDDVAVLVDGTLKILALSLDGDEDLVQVPRVTETLLSPLQPASVFRPELDAPQRIAS